MQENAPSGNEVVVAVPSGFGEFVLASFVGEDVLAAELLVNAPTAVEEVEQIVDIGTHFKSGLATAEVEVEFLINFEVDAVDPRSDGTIALAVLTTMCAEVAVAADECFVSIAVFIGCERHSSQFFGGGDVNEVGCANAGALVGGHSVGIASLGVAAHVAEVGTFVEETELGGGTRTFIDGVACVSNQAVGGNIVGVAKFRAVVAMYVGDLSEVVNLVASTIGSRDGEAMGVSSHEVEAIEVLGELSGK